MRNPMLAAAAAFATLLSTAAAVPLAKARVYCSFKTMPSNEFWVPSRYLLGGFDFGSQVLRYRAHPNPGLDCHMRHTGQWTWRQAHIGLLTPF